MHLTAFQAGKGDCLLLEDNARKHRILIDGGTSSAHREHVAPFLGKLRDKKKDIDILYVSHIDDDHIAGVLSLLDTEADWRVHEHQVKANNATHKPPEAPRPPTIGKIFHNAFRDQVGQNSGDIESMLAASARALSASDHAWARQLADVHQNLATSIKQAIRVSQRLKPGALNIPLNPDSGKKLMLLRDGQKAIKLGTVQLSILGPSPDDLTRLRKEWNKWLKEHQAEVKTLRARAVADEELLRNDVDMALAPSIAETHQLEQLELALAKQLGNRSKVTTPNLASLMFLAREGDQTILLTGDGHSQDILKGLEHLGVLAPGDHIHVNVLKVQHHGSEHNIDGPFCDRVSADHYVFSGNGEHENPDLDVLELIFDHFMLTDQRKATFWFTSTSDLSTTQDGRAHMRKVEKLMTKLKGGSKSRLAVKYISGSSIKIA
jgi:beta-lactamase superfamily II metal-dependent hydrolase